MPDMDPLFLALSAFRRRQFQPCVELATQVLEKNPNDQVRIAERFRGHSFPLRKGRMATENASIDRTTLR